MPTCLQIQCHTACEIPLILLIDIRSACRQILDQRGVPFATSVHHWISLHTIFYVNQSKLQKVLSSKPVEQLNFIINIHRFLGLCSCTKRKQGVLLETLKAAAILVLVKSAITYQHNISSSIISRT